MAPRNSTEYRTNRRLWFSLHGWLALPIWGLLALVCVTGTLSAVSSEITWLFSQQVRATNPNSSAPLPLNVLNASVQSAYPGAKVTAVRIQEPYLAYLFRTELPDGGSKQLYLNPYSGKVQGEAKGLSLREFLLALHGWLLFPWQNNYSVGWYLVTAVSVPLAGSLVTGLLVFKRFWRAFYRPQLRLSKGARVFWGDLHRLAGVWSIWFVVVICVSGLWFLVQGVLYQNHIEVVPDPPRLPREAAPITADGQPPATISFDQAVAAAKVLYPDFNTKYIAAPEHAYGVLTVRGTRGFSPLRDTANAVHLNPYSGELVAVRSVPELSPLEFVSALLVSLHFGNFAGLASKLIWFFFGVILSLMVCSGFVIWSKRTFQATRKLRARNVPVRKEPLDNLPMPPESEANV